MKYRVKLRDYLQRRQSLKKIAFFLIIFLATERFCYYQTAGFSISKIIPPSTYQTPYIEFRTEDSSTKHPIFQQPFSYLGKGAQVFAFISEDEQYVLKLIRYDHFYLRKWPFFSYLPFFLQQYQHNKIEYNQDRLYRLLTSYKIASELLKEETAMVHLSLDNQLFSRPLILKDKIGIEHQIDLKRIPYFIQRKATLIYPTLKLWMEEENLDRAKEGLTALIQLLLTRCKKGIYDKDPNLETNFGFIDNQPIQIDIGRFRMDESRKDPQVYKREIVKITENLANWLEKNYPTLYLHLQSELQMIQ